MSHRASLLGWLLPLCGAAGIAAAWVLLGLGLNRWMSAFALVAALDLALMAKWGGWPAGRDRAWIAAGGTLLAIVLANWWRVAAQMGLALGLLPWEALPKMGPGFAWTLARLANGWTDLAFYVASVALAAWLGRGRAFSARRPAPSAR